MDQIVEIKIKVFIKSLIQLEFVPCHRMKSRSLIINGKKFPICSRCMAILLGYLFIPILIFHPLAISWYLGILLNIPMIIDGYTQKWKWRKSNNTLRIVTGLLSGLGQSIIIVQCSFYLFKLLNNFI